MMRGHGLFTHPPKIDGHTITLWVLRMISYWVRDSINIDTLQMRCRQFLGQATEADRQWARKRIVETLIRIKRAADVLALAFELKLDDEELSDENARNR